MKTTAPSAQLAVGAADNRVTQPEGSSTRWVSMADKLGQLRVVSKPQRKHVAVATEDVASHHP